MMTAQAEERELTQLGWREWARLPDLGLPWMKAKMDTGARTSALHAFDIKIFEKKKKKYVRFKVHPRQRNTEKTIEVEAELVDQRHVRSSGGRRSYRPVIRTTLELSGKRLTIEMTLICREKLKYRMLIGREALRDTFVIDAGQSFRSGQLRQLRTPPASPSGKKQLRRSDENRGFITE